MKRLLCLMVISVLVLTSMAVSYAYDIPGNMYGKTYSEQRQSGGVNCVATGTTTTAMTVGINTTNTNYHVYAKVERYNNNNSTDPVLTNSSHVYGKQGAAANTSISRNYKSSSYKYVHLAFTSTSTSSSDANIVSSSAICAYQYNH